LAGRLYRKALSASTGSGGIGIIEVESLPFQTAGELQGRIAQVQETFEVGNYLFPIVFEYLIIRPGLIIELHIVAQTRATATGDGYPYKIVCTVTLFGPNFLDLIFGGVRYK
jgi:hypothetical protein